MKKRIVVAVVLAVLMAASAYAQTKSFFGLVETGTPREIQTAIDKGANVNVPDKAGVTPLMWASEFNENPEVITTLLKAGADINAKDNDGVTPLMHAAGHNPNPEVLTLLLKGGADSEAREPTYNSTALMFAAESNRNPEVIIALLAAGADAKAKDRDGDTAFDMAQDNPNLKGTDALKQLEEASK